MHLSRLITALIVYAFLTGPVRAQISEAEAAALKVERDQLRLELAQMKLRLAKLEDELAGAKMALEDALKKIAGKADEPAPEAPAPDDDAAKKEKPERLRPLGTFASFFATLPADARPNPLEGWTQFNQPKAQGWINENAPGRLVDVSLRLRQHRVERVPDPLDSNKTLRWDVHLSFASETTKVFGLDHQVVYDAGGVGGFSGRITVTEDVAKKALNLKPDHRFRVRGELYEMTLTNQKVYNRAFPGRLTLKLKHVEIEGLR